MEDANALSGAHRLHLGHHASALKAPSHQLAQSLRIFSALL